MELDGSRRNTESILGRNIVIFSPSEILPVAEEIEPSLITTDADVQDRITRNPMLLWKAVNVRRYFGIEG